MNVVRLVNTLPTTLVPAGAGKMAHVSELYEH